MSQFSREEILTKIHAGESLAGLDLAGADLSYETMKGVDFSGTNLIEAHLQNTNLEGANFSGATLTRAFMFGCNLNNAKLDEAVFRAYAEATGDDTWKPELDDEEIIEKLLKINLARAEVENSG